MEGAHPHETWWPEAEGAKAIHFHPRIPWETHKKKYRIRNLFKYDLPAGWRLLYSVKQEGIEVIAIILEWMRHKEYEKRFKYRVR